MTPPCPICLTDKEMGTFSKTLPCSTYSVLHPLSYTINELTKYIVSASVSRGVSSARAKVRKHTKRVSER